MIRSPQWFARQLAHAQDAMREADKVHTPEELAAAAAALAVDPYAPQAGFDFAPPNAGLISSGQPKPSGLADRDHLGA